MNRLLTTSLRRWRRDRHGVVAVEFALAGVLLIAMVLGVIGAGLFVWTRSGLQAAANTTARCVALGSPDCASPTAYAVALANQWVFPGIITAADVTVAPATACNGATGNYTAVTITSAHWIGSVLPAPMNTLTITTTACYVSSV